jgi:hypothetical protein
MNVGTVLHTMLLSILVCKLKKHFPEYILYIISSVPILGMCHFNAVTINMNISVPSIHTGSANADSFFYIYLTAAIMNIGANDTTCKERSLFILQLQGLK